MSHAITITDSVVVNPSGYTGASNMTAGTGNYVPANAYNSISNTSSYARWQLSASNTSTNCYVYYTFPTPSVPSGATITSVQCTARVYRNSRVGTSSIQLYANTTAKGSATSFTSTSATNVAISNTGSWSVSELSNIRLRLLGVRSSTNQTSYLYIYGANVTVNYSISGTEYEVTTSLTTNVDLTIDPSGLTNVFQGESYSVRLDGSDISNLTVTDNNVNVTSSLVRHTWTSSSGTFTGVPTSFDETNSSYNGLYGGAIDNGLTDSSSTTVARFNSNTGSNAETFIYYNFDCSSIPRNATINSVSCVVKASISRTDSTYSTNRELQLCTGTTTKGSPVTVTSTSANTYTLSGASWTRAELDNLKVRFYVKRGTSSTTSSLRPYFYGASLTISWTDTALHPYYWTYDLTNVSADHNIVFVDSSAAIDVTGVTLNQNTASIEEEGTLQLTATVLPSNASDKSVTWSSNHTNIATVNNGLVTGVTAGTAVITVTTNDGGYTATCTVTVTEPTYVTYKLATSFEVGKKYLIVNTNNGSGYAMTSEANGSGTLKGTAITVSNNKINIKQSIENSATFTVELEDSNDTETIWLKNGASYLYSDSTSHLRMDTARSPRYWHYLDSVNLIWFFNGTSNQYGYTDTSSTYKYYLECSSSGDFTDSFVSTTSLADTSGLPPMYIFVEDEGNDQTAYIKVNGGWIACSKVYKKVSGSWIEQTDLSNVFDSDTIYIKV